MSLGGVRGRKAPRFLGSEHPLATRPIVRLVSGCRTRFGGENESSPGEVVTTCKVDRFVLGSPAVGEFRRSQISVQTLYPT